MIVFLSYVVTVFSSRSYIAWNGARRLSLMICDIRILRWS